MLSQRHHLDVKIGDRTYHFHFDLASPVGELHTALTQMMGFAVAEINKHLEAQKPKVEKTDEQTSS